MILKMMETGPLMVNTYIVGDETTREAAVVDPGGDVDKILLALAEDKLKCVMIVNTHTHFDHIGGNAELKKATGAELVTHPDEARGLAQSGDAARLFGFTSISSPAPDRLVKEGETLKIGNLTARVVRMRGHSPCGIALVFDAENVAIVGDALFAGSIGRCDLPGGDMEQLLEDIRQGLFTLNDDMKVLPGHGPVTTVGREKRFNPFF
jgi:hydroxyacylglutathione hydrolase